MMYMCTPSCTHILCICKPPEVYTILEFKSKVYCLIIASPEIHVVLYTNIMVRVGESVEGYS